MSEKTCTASPAQSPTPSEQATQLPSIERSYSFVAPLNLVGSDGGVSSKDDQNLSTSSDFRFISAAELRENREPISWAIRGVIRQESLCQVFGAPGAGKSFLAIDLACCVATGKSWHGHEVKQGPVFYIVGEGLEGMRLRLRAWEQQNNAAADTLFLSSHPVPLMHDKSVASLADAIQELANEHGRPGLIVIDTLARNLGTGDENSNSDIGTLIKNLDNYLKIRFHVAVVIVHHSGHHDKSRARGASAMYAALDHEFLLEKKSEVCTLVCTKVKDEKGIESKRFRLETVQLEDLQSEDDEIVTSCVLVPTEEPAADARKLSNNDQIVLDSLIYAIRTEGVEPLESLICDENTPPPKMVVTLRQWSAIACERIESKGNSDSKYRAFKRSNAQLAEVGRVATSGGFYWATS